MTADTCALYICVGVASERISNVYRLWSSDARRSVVGKVGDHDNALVRI